jgi:hypothetical protein
VFENRVLRRIFGPKRDEMTGDWRNCIMRNFITVLLAKQNSNDQVKEDAIGRACSTNGEKRNAYMILIGKLEGKT